jgi:diguanylate cyclase (GGDEF)-like protein
MNDKEPKGSINEFINQFGKEKFYKMFFHALMETEADSIYIKDRLGQFQVINQRVVKELDVNKGHKVIGKTDSDLFGEVFGENTRREENHLIATGIAVDGIIGFRGDAQSGLNWSSTSKFPLKDEHGNIVGLIGITRDINELKIREQKLQILATHDSLTNVYNRAGLINHLDDMVHQSGTKFAVLVIDLDNFKRINDTYLHKTGDEFLIWLSWILKTSLRGNDIVARIGGDEFVIILNKVDSTEQVDHFCEKLYQNFYNSIEKRFLDLEVGISMGVSFYQENRLSPDELLWQADEALYKVKAEQKGSYRFYRSDSNS